MITNPMDRLNELMPNWNQPMNFMNQVKQGPLNFMDRLNTSGNAVNPAAFGGNELTRGQRLSRSILGHTDDKGITSPGWGGMALGTIGAVGGAYMGMKQYGLAKKNLAESKRQFNMNYAAQRQTINTNLEDRQRARVASNADAYQSVDSYMKKNKVK